MTGSGDLESRVQRLEQQVPQLRGDIAAAQQEASNAWLLAAGADRDVSDVRAELRAHRSALNALRDGQRELWEGQRELWEGQRRLEREMRAGFATVKAGMQHIVTLLDDRPADGS